MRITYSIWILFIAPLLILSACHFSGEKKSTPARSVADEGKSRKEILDGNILSDSLNPEYYCLRSQYYLEQMEVNEALADIRKAIQLDENNADYFVALSDIYLAMGRVPNCLESLNKAQELEPGNNNALLKLAKVYLILKDYQNTFAFTKKALDYDLLNPEAHFIRGYAYMELGDTALAIQNFQMAADQDQDYYEAYTELGALYAAMGNQLATSYLQTATRIDPNKEEAYYLLGMTYQEQENIPKATETYEKLLVISPEFKEAYYNLGYINLVYLNDFGTAAGYFTKAVELDPKYADAFFNRGFSYELMGDYLNARKDYLKALDIIPNYERPILGLNRLDSLAE